jgi:pyruvate dehydrogenase E2 component (dihydrolipoamide acetyltransferase)
MSQRIFPITMPKWGIEMQQGTIAGWHVEPGKAVHKGEILLDVETDKIVNAVEAPSSGVLRLIVADAGATENVGALLAVLADGSVSDDELTQFVRDFKPFDASFEPNDDAALRAPAASQPASTTEPNEGETRISPIARRVAERLGIDITQVRGTGRNGRVSKEDVEAYAASGAAVGAPGGAAIPTESAGAANAAVTVYDNAPRRTKLTAMRAAIARRLLESKQGIPHYRLAVDVDFGALIAHRGAHKPAGWSINDFLIRAAAVALLRHPALNAQLIGDEVLEFPHADISVAVATSGGLITPIVRAADTKTAAEISSQVKDLGIRARAGTLTREEITGGTFTISNLGMFGVDRFDAIINPPQVAILAVGAASDRVVAREGVAAVTKVATLTLSADHRVVDGAVGAQFLSTLKALIGAPGSL